MTKSAAEILAAAHEAERVYSNGQLCSVGEALELLEPELRSLVVDMIADCDEQHNHVARTLNRLLEGRYKHIHPTTMGRHRRKDCVTCKHPNPHICRPGRNYLEPAPRELDA